MLKDRNSSAIVAVSDLDRARAFYEDTLGLTREPGGEAAGVIGFRTGDTRLTVYRSDYAGPTRPTRSPGAWTAIWSRPSRPCGPGA